MTTSVIQSNVYYLPVRAETPEDTTAPQRTFGTRLRRAWWRLRFSGAEIWLIVRRTARQLRADGAAGRLARAERVEHARVVDPARIIDFASARRRLRPASA